MLRPSVLVAAAALGTAAIIALRAGQGDQAPPQVFGQLADDPTADTNTNTNTPGILDTMVSTVQNYTTSISTALQDPNVRAFLQLIRTGEGTTGPNGYRTLFGGGLFEGFADHPRQLITRNGITSSAAGAYQFLSGTWDEMRTQYGLPDFSPSSQDLACIGLIKRRNALADVIAGRFSTAIMKCNKEWASLPGSPYGQPTLSLARARDVLASAGGISVEALA